MNTYLDNSMEAHFSHWEAIKHDRHWQKFSKQGVGTTSFVKNNDGTTWNPISLTNSKCYSRYKIHRWECYNMHYYSKVREAQNNTKLSKDNGWIKVGEKEGRVTPTNLKILKINKGLFILKSICLFLKFTISILWYLR